MSDQTRRIAKVLVTLTTLLFLVSFGGMLAVGWLLVPLHWWAARDNGIYGTFGWGLLAAASTFEMAWALTFLLSDSEGWAIVPGIIVAVVTFAVFALRGSRRWVFHQSIVE